MQLAPRMRSGAPMARSIRAKSVGFFWAREKGGISPRGEPANNFISRASHANREAMQKTFTGRWKSGWLRSDGRRDVSSRNRRNASRCVSIRNERAREKFLKESTQRSEHRTDNERRAKRERGTRKFLKESTQRSERPTDKQRKEKRELMSGLRVCAAA